MDQSFSPRNLRLIWDAEARRGKDLLAYYPDVRAAYDEAREARRTAQAIHASNTSYIGPPEKSPSAITVRTRRRADDLLQDALTKTSQKLVDQTERDTFKWGLHPTSKIRAGRQLYSIANDPVTLFADRQLQRILSSQSHERPSSRQAVVSGLISTIDNDLPKAIFRADVKDFYNTVDHNILLSKIEKSQLAPTPRRLIKRLLEEMGTLTQSNYGLPTGVGLSARLAEFYISHLDKTLRETSRVIYYGRYVDDIVIVWGDPETAGIGSEEAASAVQDQLDSLNLTLNSSKMHYIQLSASKTLRKFDFLGYEFDYQGQKGLAVNLTKNRFRTIRGRIEKSFDAWAKADDLNHGRRSLLIDRLRLLAGNTRLSHNKQNAMVGIYFSNPHLSDPTMLSGLDQFLQHQIAQSHPPTDLDEKLREISFVNGFSNRTVYRFTPRRLKDLRGVWHA